VRMKVIRLEKVVDLTNWGDIVKVKDGYARNFLIRAMRLAVGPLQMDGDHAMQIALHTDV
jgi:Ribosomal protein L9, N-terminal domain